jgi:predicted MFS family arabinose efflux permease
MSAIDTPRGRSVLIVGHVAGMVDMVALPVWVGNLVQHYGFNPQQAGGIVTLFLLGVVIASVLLAPRFERLPRRWLATIGYGISACAFLAASTVHNFGQLAILHVLGGLGVGCALSMTHGTIGRSLNPHRLFAYAQAVLGLFAIGFLGAVPQVIASNGGPAFFTVLMGVMLVAALCTAVGFPVAQTVTTSQTESQPMQGIGRGTWFAIAGVLLLTLNQAMMFSFLERIGVDRHFGVDRVNLVLVATGILGLFPALIAALLQKRLNPRTVALAAPWVQTLLALIVTHAAIFVPYAVAGSFYPFVTLFAHTFLFGLIARLDPSGRAVASTPAMVMTGSAIGPFLAGTLVLTMGYEAIGVGVAVVAVVSTVLVSRISRASSAPESGMVGLVN